MMKATFTAVRAVGAEFVWRTLKPLIITGAVPCIILLAIGAWLTTVNAWWWLLEVLFIGASLLLVLIALLIRAILRRIGSPLTKSQRQLVVDFTDKLERSIESIRTPYPVVLWYVVRDTIRPRSGAFVKTVAEDSRTLGPDFAALCKALSDTAVRR